MATLANAVDPGTFADLVVASLVESAQATSGNDRAKSQLEDVHVATWLAPTWDGFTEQVRSAIDLAMARLALENSAAGSERQALYALVDKLLPDVRVRHLERKIEQLLDVVADTHDPMAEFQAAVAADNTAIRQRFVQEIETFTSAQVAARAGHEAKNRHQTAARWKALRRIFAVSYQGQDRFPAFQFDADGKPRPVIKKVLEVLPDNRTPWQVAFWFVSSNSWLGGPAPSDRLDDADAVIEAAVHESDEIGG
ncbi:hypothetical protein [Sphingomonas sanguinis]|jgi:hypothetical protein|uniref:DUF2384 domain-containing protein n=1 Tax=Sphingomonas sanguinis TaxID=33051 RepID=A0A7Y7UTT3_9SPHN|nr:hypothetical protein [Sphingomonas sanguinis]MBZ6384052.1 hypothetical protein [Sphingomonas sanguinis]NNG50387.1 hypothetical protein [Sphingomonas sanguinis]NNG55511.1 hypothetical protein [Sphingomonas sanguinis]NVP33343.1 hypothetical protein [Sphingomonas sanguinis]